MNLTNHFSHITFKKLSSVEVDINISNQHELNGVSSLKTIFGANGRRNIPANFIYLDKSEDDIVEEEGFLSWYDARESHPTRSEYRLYYSSKTVLALCSEGDYIILAYHQELNKALVLAISKDSIYLNEIKWLFRLDVNTLQVDEKFRNINVGNRNLTFLEILSLRAIGIEVQQNTEIDFSVLDYYKSNLNFPTTLKFSEIARNVTKIHNQINEIEEPDNALLKFIETEEILFKHLEKTIINSELQHKLTGNNLDVDWFLSYSLSVHNRRKSRIGHSLEIHLEHIFNTNQLKFERGKITENKSKPDFIFPNSSSYHNALFPNKNLRILASKSTCKDRWRQVLSEAAKVEKKHLLTLERAISENQTNEMKSNRLQLVVPKDIQATYSFNQLSELMSLQEFINEIKSLNY